MSALTSSPAAPEDSPFSFLCRFKSQWLSPKQAAEAIGRTREFVYGMIEEGKLEAHGPKGRKVARYQITRRSVVRLLGETAAYDPATHDAWVIQFILSLNESQLAALAARAKAILG